MKSSPAAPAQRTDVAELYIELRPLLLSVAAGKFRVPADDAEALLHDVLLSFITATVHIENPRMWLVGAICNASRAYWRTRARVAAAETNELAGAKATIDSDQFEKAVALRRVLDSLSARDRMVLRLHYYEQLTIAEIALAFGTTVKYATKLVCKALRRARIRYESAAPPAARRAQPPR